MVSSTSELPILPDRPSKSRYRLGSRVPEWREIWPTLWILQSITNITSKQCNNMRFNDNSCEHTLTHTTPQINNRGPIYLNSPAATLLSGPRLVESKHATSEAMRQPTPHFSLGSKAGTPLTLAWARWQDFYCSTSQLAHSILATPHATNTQTKRTCDAIMTNLVKVESLETPIGTGFGFGFLVDC